jgi:hypothetical protein
VHHVLEQPRGEMSKGVHSDDLLGIRPCWKWSNVSSRFGVGEIRFVVSVELLRADGESVVDAVRATVGTNGVASANCGRATSDNNWASLIGVLCTCCVLANGVMWLDNLLYVPHLRGMGSTPACPG